MTTNTILVLNAGSSSLKARVFEATPSLPLLAEGRITGIGTQPQLVWNDKVMEEFPRQLDHTDAINELLEWLQHCGESWSLRIAGHRIVHGGEMFTAPVILTSEVRLALETLIPLAPLHQSANLAAVRTLAEANPKLTQIGCFDTAFHCHHAPVFRFYALPQYLSEHGVRRYGFHGLSYEWIAQVLAREYPELAQARVVVAHLGNGASLCAMRAGVSVDTTMGMTALDGLPMGTRCGSIDPGVILYLLRELDLDADRIEQILSYESGLAGLSGISHDVRDLLASDSQEADFAVRFFCTMTAQHIARMVVALGGIDALVFTGGIGEHAESVRSQILERLSVFPPFETLVIAANEERMIAEHCWKFVKQ